MTSVEALAVVAGFSSGFILEDKNKFWHGVGIGLLALGFGVAMRDSVLIYLGSAELVGICAIPLTILFRRVKNRLSK